VLDGNLCALQAAKGHVNVFPYDGAIVTDPEATITIDEERRVVQIDHVTRLP